MFPQTMMTNTLTIPAVQLPKTAIIGASGFMGKRFLSAYRTIHPDCIGTSKTPSEVEQLSHFDLMNPDIGPLRLAETGHTEALILGAIPNIDRCEKERELTRKVNVEGTCELIKQLSTEGIKPIFFSSDCVFDGLTGNYDDDARQNPVIEYGRQKAEVESRIAGLSRNYLVVRLSKVYSLNKGDNTLLDEMAHALISGNIVRAAYDQVFCPTLISDVIFAVAALQSQGRKGIVNVCSPEAWSRYDVATAIADRLQIDRNRIKRITLDEFGFTYLRPKNTSMCAQRLSAEAPFAFTPLSKALDVVVGNWSGINFQLGH